ncbi:MAG: aldo/keto reductase [Sphingomonas bacterium]|nr:aldo/keto reductase [Sphingomonas bacterium]
MTDTPLPSRPIGARAVSAVSLGCMNLSHAYGTPPSEEDGARLLNRALDLGITMLDTAALYGGGDNERLLGKAVMHRRRHFMLASKCVLDVYDGKRGIDGSPAAIAKTLDGALTRLGTDHIDLYYMHRLDKKVPVEESVGALARAVEAGKIGAIGLSEMSAATIRRAHAVHPIAAVQSEYSPAVRNPEVAVLATCAEIGAALVAFSPVARGLLADAIHHDDYVKGDIRAAMPRFVGERLITNLARVARFNALAQAAGMTPAQLAIGWVIAQAPHIVALPGTTSIAHLEDDIAAATKTLDPALLASVDDLLPPNALSGARYTAAMQAQIDTETLMDEELA